MDRLLLKTMIVDPSKALLSGGKPHLFANARTTRSTYLLKMGTRPVALLGDLFMIGS